MSAQLAAAPLLGKPDPLVSTSPSFPALLRGVVTFRLRGIPWILWLQDILPDGAATTGYLKQRGLAHRCSRSLESAACRTADHIVVLSESFLENLVRKWVSDEKVTVAYNPATIFRNPAAARRGEIPEPPRVLCMGNIGKSRGPTHIVKAFEDSGVLKDKNAELAPAGAGSPRMK